MIQKPKNGYSLSRLLETGVVVDAELVVLEVLAGVLVLLVTVTGVALGVEEEVRLPVSAPVDVAPELRELAVVDGRLRNRRRKECKYNVPTTQRKQ